MSKPRLLSTPWVLIVLATLITLPLSAELPSLNKQPWFGYFAAFSNSKYCFGVTADGKMNLMPMLGRDHPVSKQLAISIKISIVEVAPDGKATLKKIKPESLSSPEAATDKLEKTTIIGKVTGDASFEVTIEQLRDVISIGGRILDPGTLKKNPLRFSIQWDLPNPYSSAKKSSPREIRAFEKTISGDRLQLTLVDKKRKRLKLEEKVGANSEEINGLGIAEAEIEVKPYKGRKFIVETTPNATLKLWNPTTQPLHEGFSLVWTPDPAKDPEGKARLSFQVK